MALPAATPATHLSNLLSSANLLNAHRALTVSSFPAAAAAAAASPAPYVPDPLEFDIATLASQARAEAEERQRGFADAVPTEEDLARLIIEEERLAEQVSQARKRYSIKTRQREEARIKKDKAIARIEEDNKNMRAKLA